MEKNTGYTAETLYKSARTGNYFKDPEKAAKDGLCACGKEREKNRYKCPECLKELVLNARLTQMVVLSTKKPKPWSEKNPAYDYNTDEWFSDSHEVTEHYSSEGLDTSKLLLFEGKPITVQHIDESYFVDQLPSEVDFELPKEFTEALKRLNEIAAKHITHYEPDTNKRVKID